MATLYVENVPDELYEALRDRARRRHHSMAAEVVALLADSIPTARQLRGRQEIVHRLERMASVKKLLRKRTFPTAEEMQRQDRNR